MEAGEGEARQPRAVAQVVHITSQGYFIYVQSAVTDTPGGVQCDCPGKIHSPQHQKYIIFVNF